MAESTNGMVRLDTFNCELYHGQVKTHSIPMRGITMREIRLLRHIHGEDAILDKEIQKLEPIEVNEKEFLFKLARKYGSTSDPLYGKKRIEKILDTSLAGFETWLEENLELESMEREERNRAHQGQMAAERLRQTAAAISTVARAQGVDIPAAAPAAAG